MATPLSNPVPAEAGFGGHIREVALAVILEEAVGVFRRRLIQRLDVGAVGEKDIQVVRRCCNRRALHPQPWSRAHGAGAFRSFPGGMRWAGRRSGWAPLHSVRMRLPRRRPWPSPARARYVLMRAVHGRSARTSRMSGGGGSSAASFLTLSNSACASCSRPKELNSLPNR